MRRLLLLAGGCLALKASAADGGPRIEASEPRAFGYQVGDVVQRRVSVLAPDGWQLDVSSLPRPGGRGSAIELRSVVATSAAEPGGRRHELALQYQVFLAPVAVRTLEIPPLRLRFTSAARSEELRVDAWPLTVAPLVPLEVSPRRGLGELQPDIAPPHIDTAALRWRVVAYAGLSALLLATLAIERFGAPWRAARQRPFAQAWRRLRRLPQDPAQVEWRTACQQVHEALNRGAGEVLFEAGLARFIAARPSFAGLRDDIARFLQLSRREFFGGAERGPDDARWLVGLCRRLRDAERSSE